MAGTYLPPLNFTTSMFSQNSMRSSKSAPNLSQIDMNPQYGNYTFQATNNNHTPNFGNMNNNPNFTTSPLSNFVISHPDLMIHSGMTYLGNPNKNKK